MISSDGSVSIDPSLQELIRAFEMLDPPKVVEIEYRLHYNDVGDIYMATHLPTDHPVDTKYVVVTDQSEYKNFWKYRVDQGKLIEIVHDSRNRTALHKGESGFRVVKNQAALLLEDSEDFTHTEFYVHRK
jgi:hypothetical protein|tara:strand:+ start:2636 stop:3025 length:390 start_codon:yes stop_codon:yes gene_type:complete